MEFDVRRSHVYFMHDAPDNGLNTTLEIRYLQTNVQTKILTRTANWQMKRYASLCYLLLSVFL